MTTAQRRGSVLVLVVGVLALLAIIALVYATIGQADRRGAAALVSKQRVEDQSQAIADYLAQMVADSTMQIAWQRTTGPDGTQTDSRYHPLRDYPGVDPLMQTATNDPSRKYTSTGTMLAPWNGGQAYDPRVAMNPWLAPIEPTRLNPAGAPYSDPAHPFMDTGDWASISNPSPDGRPVNLALLRNNFAIPSGVGPGTISDNLFLLRVTGPGVVQTTRNLENGAGAPADVNVPAHWTTRQFGLFRPVGDTSVQPGDVRNLDNMFADSDGDGMYDSRWFELVDAFRFDAGADGVYGTADDRILPAYSVIGYQGPMRLFIASRIIDLSGLVNVNVATTLREAGIINATVAPKQYYPLGLYPTDVDFERLLTMRDVYHVYGGGYGLPGYFAQPTTSQRASNYTQYENGYELVGQGAYSAVLAAQLNGSIPGTGPAGAMGPNVVPGGFTGLFPSNTFTAESRALLYQSWSRDPNGATFLTGAPNVQFSYGSAFGISDLAELLTYWTVNNPGMTSRLEATTDGRSDQYPNLGPMRSNRPLDLERDVNNTAVGSSRFRQATDVRHLLTTISGARPLAPTVLPGNASGGSLLLSEVKPDVNALLSDILRPTNPTQKNVTSLLMFYADALLPYSAETRAWERNNAQARALHYGGVRTGFDGNAAELALRSAAHMTANLISMRDRSDDPVMLTLLLDEQERNTLDSNPTNADGLLKYPGWDAAPQTNKGAPGRARLAARADLNNGNAANKRLATSPYNQVPGQISAPALNIYSMTPQPFVVQAATFVMYADVHEGHGGDGKVARPPTPPEWQILTGAGPGGTDIIQNNPITINGLVRKSNADFMLEMVAFQITNPFDIDIPLTALDNTGVAVADGTPVSDTDFRYYLEFAGKFYKIADTDFLSGQNPKSIVLKARETKVLYVLGENPQDIAGRWRIADPSVPGGAAGTTMVQNWVHSKLRIPDAAGVPQNPIRIVPFDPQSGVSAAVLPGDQPGVINPQGAGVASDPNLNRQVRLWKAMRTGTAGAGVPHARSNDMLIDRLRDPDNTGRPSLDRRMQQRNTQVVGTLAGPDYTMPESATYPPLDNTGFAICYYGSIRRPDTPGGTLPLGALPAYCVEARSSVSGHFASHNKAEMLTADPRVPKKADFLVPVGQGPFATTVTLPGAPGRRNLWRLQENAKLLDSITDNPNVRTGSLISRSGPGNSGPAFDELFVQLHKVRAAGTNSDPLPPLRVADLLLPMAIGPVHNPSAPTLEEQWTTFGEALAMALDYDSPSDTSDPMYAVGRVDAGGAVTAAYDRGHLRLDAFAPFDDLNRNGVYEPIQGEALRAEGVPLAFNVLTRARVLKYGSINSMMSGLININTAPMMVLRMLPMVAPDPFTWAATASIRPLYTPANERYDVASTIVAYRDKVIALSRPTIGGGNSPRIADFRDANDGSAVVPNADPLTAGPEANGRAYATGFSAIHEDAGFRGVGEIMAARMAAVGFNNNMPSLIPANAAEAADNSIDRFARDGVVFDPRDASGKLIGATTTLHGTGLLPSAIKDEYDQKLAIADAMLNSISTRSDVFAVWFVVRGYLPSDVTGLGPDDPMVPTVSRRYVMVIDRSGVTAVGQKPKVLLFQEVPAN